MTYIDTANEYHFVIERINVDTQHVETLTEIIIARNEDEARKILSFKCGSKIVVINTEEKIINV